MDSASETIWVIYSENRIIIKKTIIPSTKKVYWEIAKKAMFTAILKAFS